MSFLTQHVPDDARRGPYWRVGCPFCSWTSGTLPFETEAKAMCAVKLHSVLCKRSDIR